MPDETIIKQHALLVRLGFSEISTTFISDLHAEQIGDAISQIFSRDIPPKEAQRAIRDNRLATFMERNKAYAPEGRQRGAIAALPNGTIWGRNCNLSHTENNQLVNAGFLDKTTLMRSVLSARK
jgi:hypothetical protein